MATCENTRIRYSGDGEQRFFTFPFTYIASDDIMVSLWDDNLKEYVDQPNKFVFANATTIELFVAPPAPTDPEIPNVQISRITGLDDMKHTFYPGSNIRAQDLNDDFDQLRLAQEEQRCELETYKEIADEKYISNDEYLDRDDQESGKWASAVTRSL